jgi:hypothetical protein
MIGFAVPLYAASLGVPQPTVCPKHHVQMIRKVVRVSYGLRGPDPDYIKAMSRHFPYAEAWVSGGCDPRFGPRTAPVYACPVCKRAQLEWARRHPKNPEVESLL